MYVKHLFLNLIYKKLITTNKFFYLESPVNINKKLTLNQELNFDLTNFNDNYKIKNYYRTNYFYNKLFITDIKNLK